MEFKEFLDTAEKIGVGNGCTCYIYDDYIKDAKLQYEYGAWYICQNERSGMSCEDKRGYDYSWKCSTENEVKGIRDLKPKKKGIFKGGLDVGDRLIEKNGESSTVMATLDDVVLLGRNRYRDDWLTAGAWYGYDELVGLKFCLFQKETAKKMTKEEIEKELGYKITIV